MGLPRTTRGRKRSSQASQDEFSSPPKRLHLSPKPGLADLKGETLKHIFSHFSLTELSRLAMTTRDLATHVFHFSLSAEALPILLPSMLTPAAKSAATKYKVEGSPTSLGLDPSTARLNFRRLGELAKRLTCLLPTRERVRLSAQLVGRLTYQEGSAGPLMSAIGVFIHALIRGWADAECSVAAEVVLQMFDAEEQISELLAEEYILGSRVRQELLARNFLYSVFYGEVAPGVNKAEIIRQQRLWLRSLISFSCPPGRKQVVGAARVLLLMTTPARDQGVQWADHVGIIDLKRSTWIILTGGSNSCHIDCGRCTLWPPGLPTPSPPARTSDRPFHRLALHLVQAADQVAPGKCWLCSPPWPCFY